MMANLVHFLQYVALKQYFDMRDQQARGIVAGAAVSVVSPVPPAGRGVEADRHRVVRIQAE
ncbi:hypothetical protein D3W54_14400 [Komagataeibacter medellinensis]|uniref:Uncharacterized protein n=2 Tax=Komagataeibacter medellinensis TaxID=1177712 RepID=A0ABQ6VRB5_9PROT|nr:hypothetical protein D3W54_14400 [Komagataeibacter medellinensis]